MEIVFRQVDQIQKRIVQNGEILKFKGKNVVLREVYSYLGFFLV